MSVCLCLPEDESGDETKESLTFTKLLSPLLLLLLPPSQIPVRAEEESRECREQEYKDRFGNCKPCKQCDAGQELSKVWKPLWTLELGDLSEVRREPRPHRKQPCRVFDLGKREV